MELLDDMIFGISHPARQVLHSKEQIGSWSQTCSEAPNS